MKIFTLYYYVADTCGNEDSYLVGYFQAKSKDEAEKVFLKGFLTGFNVVDFKLSSAKELKKKARENIKNGSYN